METASGSAPPSRGTEPTASTILTLTPNPAVDQMVWLERLRLGDVNRLLGTQLDPAGKGVNAARMAHRLGARAVALGFVGGETGAMIERLLELEQVEHDFVWIPGRTRFNTTMVAAGRWTSLRGTGPTVEPAHLEQLEKLVEARLCPGSMLVMAGSLPPGVPDDFYARYVRLARGRGVPVLLDAAGEPLRLGILEKPDLIKPNLAEAEDVLGRKISSLEDARQAALELVARGVGTVVISMGGDGAVCAQGSQAWVAHPPQVERRSTVGTGDSMVAGIAVSLSRGLPIEEVLRWATAAGAATAMTPGTANGTRSQVESLLEEVHVEPLLPAPGLGGPAPLGAGAHD
jgi:1-phosphofructokinase family hexose kinase